MANKRLLARLAALEAILDENGHIRDQYLREATPQDYQVIARELAALGGGNTTPPPATGGTDLATDFATAENLLRTGNKVASTNPPAVYKGVHALHLPATGLGWVESTLDSGDSGTMILSPFTALPAGNAYDNKAAYTKAYGSLETVANDTSYSESFALIDGTIARMSVEMVAGARTILHKVSNDNRATWTTLRSNPNSDELYLKVFGGNTAINAIRYGGDFTL